MNKIGYMCGTDFDFELEVEMGGDNDTYPRIYPSIREAQDKRKCLKPDAKSHCSIYKVEITKLETVQKDDLH